MLASTDLDLNYLEFTRLDLCFGGLLLFLFVVQVLAIIHDLGNGGSGGRRYLDEVQGTLLCFCQRDGERYNTEILSFGGYDAQFRRFDLMIYFDANSQLIGITGIIYSIFLYTAQGSLCMLGLPYKIEHMPEDFLSNNLSKPHHRKAIAALVVTIVIFGIALVWYAVRPSPAPAVTEVVIDPITARQTLLSAPNPTVTLTTQEATARQAILKEKNPSTKLSSEQSKAKQAILSNL